MTVPIRDQVEPPRPADAGGSGIDPATRRATLRRRFRVPGSTKRSAAIGADLDAGTITIDDAAGAGALGSHRHLLTGSGVLVIGAAVRDALQCFRQWILIRRKPRVDLI